MPKRKTDAEFKAEVKQLTHGEYTPLEPYQGTSVPILMKHNKCGYKWKVRPNGFINKGQRCPKCAIKQRADKQRKSNTVFLKELHDIVGNEYTPLEEYKGNRTPILMRHNKCGFVWKATPHNLLAGHGCPQCAHNAKQTTASFKKKVQQLVGNEYTVLGTYVTANTSIKMRHNKCGYVWNVKPSSFVNTGTRCPHCGKISAANKLRSSTEDFKKQVYALVNTEYTVLGEYINTNTKILMRHNKCGHEFMMQPYCFIHQGQRCPKCAGNMYKSNAVFLKELHDIVGDEYTTLEKYQGTHTPILMKHNKCGYKWKVSPDNFINRGVRCPHCNQSHGELFVEHYLKQHHLHYVAQKKFTDLHDKRLLSYDFCVNHHVLIEYQGIQHYQACDHFGGKQQFAVQQRHDQLKAQYAKQHDYVLLAIPYTVDTQTNVNKYLNKHLPCTHN